MNTEYMSDIIRDLKAELHQVKKKAQGLSAADDAQLYYNGVIVGLQHSIGKFEMWLYNVNPKKPKAAAQNKGAKNRTKKEDISQAEQCGGACGAML